MSDVEEGDSEDEGAQKGPQSAGILSFDGELSAAQKADALDKKLNPTPLPTFPLATSSASVPEPAKSYEEMADGKIGNKWAKVAADFDEESLQVDANVHSALRSYADVVMTEMDHKNGHRVRANYMLHVVKHITEARERVMKNNKVIRKLDKQDACDVLGEHIRDSGFVRPRILILCPFRSVAFELVKLLKDLLPDCKQTMNWQRFVTEFSEEQDDEPGLKVSPEWNHLFDGNNDDKFRLGISVGKSALKLYAPFASADILISSPLGLRLISGVEGDKRREIDFLTSLEMVILDRADALWMQNPEHVHEVLMPATGRCPPSARRISEG